MKLTVCSVFDSATQTFGRPVFVHAAGQAIRSFADEVNRESDTDLFRHPDDFELYMIGVFDDTDGTFECNGPQVILRGKDARAMATSKE